VASAVEGLGGVGEFWALDNPDVRVRGRFTAEDGKKPEVNLDEGLKPDPRVQQVPGGLALTGSAAQVVEAFRPTTLHGRLDTGDQVTLLDARNFGGDGQFGVPRYQAHTVVLGALVDGPTQRYSALRIRFDDPSWLAHLTDGESSVVEDDRSTLIVERSDDGNWIVYESAQPLTLRELRSRGETSCLTLARLMLDRGVVTGARQVRVEPDAAWATVLGSERFAASDPHDPFDTLLPREELTVERFAKWIELDDRLDGLASAVVEPLSGALQLQAQAVSSLVEGLHRRLPYQQFHIDPDDNNKKRFERIQKKAKDAAETQAETEGLDKELVRKLVRQSLSYFWQVGFADRATDVVNAVSEAVPEIIESLTDLPSELKHARNEMAHHLQLDELKEPLLQRYPRYMVIIAITPWLLRGLLLLHAGIDRDHLHDGYIGYEPFNFARANVAEFVTELGWELPAPQPCPRCAARC
jgi:hypothetical protein